MTQILSQGSYHGLKGGRRTESNRIINRGLGTTPSFFLGVSIYGIACGRGGIRGRGETRGRGDVDLGLPPPLAERVDFKESVKEAQYLVNLKILR
jgi:hypothetical protein